MTKDHLMIVASPTNQWEQKISGYPGREVVLDPIPIDSVMKMLAHQIEIVNKRYLGYFDPSRPTIGLVIYEAVRNTSTWIRKALRFRSWGYDLVCLFDGSNDILTLEIMASRRNFPVRICLLDQELDTFDPRLETFNYMAFTPREFMELMHENLRDVNQTIFEWNEICSEHKPYFDHEPPVGPIVQTVMNRIEDRLLYSIHRKEVELYDVFRAFGEANSILFGGAWEIDFEFKESGEWIWIRTFLQNLHFDRLSFVLKEEFSASYDDLDSVRIETDRLEDFVIDHIHGCVLNMVLWNRMLEGGFPLSGQPIGS